MINLNVFTLQVDASLSFDTYLASHTSHLHDIAIGRKGKFDALIIGIELTLIHFLSYNVIY